MYNLRALNNKEKDKCCGLDCISGLDSLTFPLLARDGTDYDCLSYSWNHCVNFLPTLNASRQVSTRRLDTLSQKATQRLQRESTSPHSRVLGRIQYIIFFNWEIAN